MVKFYTAVIGGGASGILAGISSKLSGHETVICERMPSIGRKLLACGGGRCNFLNDRLDESCYGPEAGILVKSVFSRFGKNRLLDFFSGLGLEYYCRDGKYFPVTDQSSTVLRLLEIEIERLKIPVETGFALADISESGDGFCLSSSSGKKITAGRVILASGGRSYPSLGSDGSCYRFCRGFGHRVIEPVPSAVAVETSDKTCRQLQGQKIPAAASAVIDGKINPAENGELLFTAYGLSGTVILDISRDLSIALNRGPARKAEIFIDLAPFLGEKELAAELSRRIEKGFAAEDLLCGILPNRFGVVFKKLLQAKDSCAIAAFFKKMVFQAVKTRGWNEAEFTCGGVDTSEVDPGTLESLKKKGLYFCGEILDVQGKRGGYNLAWAFASGLTAGLTGQ